MAGNYKLRKRKIDLHKISPDQADRMSKQIGDEIARIMDEANNKCNAMLNIYGLQTAIGYKIIKTEEKNKKKTNKTALKKAAKQ